MWALAKRQENLVTREQLIALGYSAKAIRHRVKRRRLHALWPGVYAVGSPHVTRRGEWMAAVLACGPGAALSHESAAALWGMREDRRRLIEVSVPSRRNPRLRGIRVHRRSNLARSDLAKHQRIPVTTPATTLVDLAARLSRSDLEAAINQADKLDLITPEGLRRALEDLPHRPGRVKLREVLDRRTFVLTESELERLFLPIARRTGLGSPVTGKYVNGFKVDFFWPDLGLVVETDGLRYHRTPAQQARGHLRDQAHTAAGMTPLRFSHAQVKYEPDYVGRVLAMVAGRLRGAR